ncbi:thioredoxin fold domain-containing protein [Thiomonas sp. FB-Cd]|uniref:thioredoxin fold domain-containing protein n=1 Tax=Thiomonas sp. FB-Cd TaxID=1158292 RepID=UPI0004DF6967|nr:thioredoxin fold domain-containing protein [Thiomonas sp. FB-Cd]
MPNNQGTRSMRRHVLRSLALLPLVGRLPLAHAAQSTGQADAVWSQIHEATWIGEGRGTRVLYIFFDPNCPYCHQLYGMLRAFVGKADVQLRWIVLGMLTPSSLPKAAAILQAANPLQAFHTNEADYDFAANGQPGGGITPATTITPKAREELARNLAIYRAHKLFGVPVLLWRTASGRAALLVGVPSDAQLKDIIESCR